MAKSIDEGRFVEVGGLQQWVTVRGADAANPALMIVTGAGAAFSPMAPLFEPWEQAFTLVQWDQPGAGATLARGGAAPEPFTYDRLARDGLAVADWACGRLGLPSLGLFAISGGSVTGLKMVNASPRRIGAYVGNGQIVDWAAQEAESYRIILARARAAGDAAAAAEIEGVGPPPWTDVQGDIVKGKHANAMTPAEQAALAPALMARLREPPPDARYVARGLPQVDVYAASLAAYQRLKPELAGFRARDLGLAFEAPMVFLQGAQDAHTPAAAVRAYAGEIAAPAVVYEEIEEGGHMSTFLVARLLDLLVREVRPLLAGGS